MSGMSDLELVAQAMAPTNQSTPNTKDAKAKNEPPAQNDAPGSTSINPSKPLDGITHPGQADPLVKPKDPDADGPNGDADGADPEWHALAELKQINDALKAAGGAGGSDGLDGLEGLGGMEGLEGMDEEQIGELLRQMDAAGVVADDLEGKLDALLENLGRAEREMLGLGLGGADGKK